MKLLSPQLQAFLAVVNHKTVHAAAKALFITQTAVTQRIKNLEKRLANALFIRTRRGMEITKEGQALLRYCQQVQALEGEALSFIEGAGIAKNTSLALCAPTTIMHSRIMPNCFPVMRAFPRLMLQFIINDKENSPQLLRTGKCQIAIFDSRFLSDEMSHQMLRPEEYVMVATTKWRKRSLTDIIENEKIIDFDVEDRMTFDYLSHYGYLSLANKDRYFVNRTELLAIMIAEGIGYGILPYEFAKPYLAQKKLCLLNRGLTYPHQLAIAWFPRHQPPAYFNQLISACCR